MKKEFSTFSGTVPALYDQYMGPLFFEPYAADIASRLKENNVHKVLEIACGTGRATNHIRKAIPASADLIATDLNPGMLAVAKETLKETNIEFRIADAQALPFVDESFDLIVCQFGLMFVPDKPTAFREAFRILKKGGRLLFNTWDRIENNPLSGTVKDIIATFFAPGNSPDFYKVPFSMHNEQELKRLMEDAGFTNITIDLVTKEGVTPTAADGAKGLVLGTPAFMEISATDPSAPEKIVAIAEKEIARLYGDNPCKSELNAWVCEGWK